MTKSNSQKIHRLVGLGILAATIIVLQSIVGAISIGPFTITLSLIPIIIGAILYGPAAGAALGGIFGLVVTYAVIAGTDVGGHIMLEQNAVVTVAVCLIKGIAAGLVAGLIYRLLEKKNTLLATASAAVLCPICNSGILGITVISVFGNLANEWAAGVAAEKGLEQVPSAVSYVIFYMIGANFLIELALNILLIPAVIRIIGAVRKTVAK